MSAEDGESVHALHGIVPERNVLICSFATRAVRTSPPVQHRAALLNERMEVVHENGRVLMRESERLQRTSVAKATIDENRIKAAAPCAASWRPYHIGLGLREAYIGRARRESATLPLACPIRRLCRAPRDARSSRSRCRPSRMRIHHLLVARTM